LRLGGHVTLPRHKSEKYRHRQAGRLSSWILGDENGQASETLANNLPANNADNRFHGRLYRAPEEFGQVGIRLLA